MSLPVERWTDHDDGRLREQLERGNGKVSWAELTRLAFPEGKFNKQDCIERWRQLSKPKALRGPWTKDEDAKLEGLVAQFGSEKWVMIASEMGSRSGKQCRERWHNHLDPSINKGEWTAAEDEIIHQLYAKIGSRWAEMAKHLPGRPDNAIKNYWNASLVRQKRRRGGSISSLTGALDLSAGDSPPGMSRSTSSNSLSSAAGARFAPYANTVVRSPSMIKSRSESGSSLASLTGLSPLRRGSVEQFPPSFASPYYSPGMTRSQSYQPLQEAPPAGSRAFVYPSPVVARDLNKEMADPSRNTAYMYAARDTPPTTPDRSPAYRRPHANSSPAAPAYPFAAYSSPPSPALTGPHPGHAPQLSLDQVIDSSHAWSERAHPPARLSEDEFGDELGYETLQPMDQQHDVVARGRPYTEEPQSQSYFHSHAHALEYAPTHSHANSIDSQQSGVCQVLAPYASKPLAHQLHHVASEDSFYGDSANSASPSPYAEPSQGFVHPNHYPEVDQWGRPYAPPTEADHQALLRRQSSAQFQLQEPARDVASGLPVYAQEGYYHAYRPTEALYQEYTEDSKPTLHRQESNLSTASTRSSQSSYFTPSATAHYDFEAPTSRRHSPKSLAFSRADPAGAHEAFATPSPAQVQQQAFGAPRMYHRSSRPSDSSSTSSSSQYQTSVGLAGPIELPSGAEAALPSYAAAGTNGWGTRFAGSSSGSTPGSTKPDSPLSAAFSRSPANMSPGPAGAGGPLVGKGIAKHPTTDLMEVDRNGRACLPGL